MSSRGFLCLPDAKFAQQCTTDNRNNISLQSKQAEYYSYLSKSISPALRDSDSTTLDLSQRSRIPKNFARLRGYLYRGLSLLVYLPLLSAIYLPRNFPRKRSSARRAVKHVLSERSAGRNSSNGRRAPIDAYFQSVASRRRVRQ